MLVIEDDQESRELLSITLLEAGHNVKFATDGKEALELAGELQSFAITLDIMMPVVDGFDVIAELKTHPQTIDIPVIVCTVKELENYEKEHLEKSVSFVTKKGILGKQDLLDCIEKIGNTTE